MAIGHLAPPAADRETNHGVMPTPLAALQGGVEDCYTEGRLSTATGLTRSAYAHHEERDTDGASMFDGETARSIAGKRSVVCCTSV